MDPKKKFLFGLGIYLIFVALMWWSVGVASRVVDAQAQASTLAVPEARPYASGILVTHCSNAVALIFVDLEGQLHPQHLKDLSRAQLRQVLNQAPADKLLQVSVPCPSDQST